MSEYAEDHLEKLSVVPLVQDTTHPDIADDDDSAAGALVAIDGAPVDGGVPTYDVGTGKHTSQVSGALGGMVPTLITSGETFTIPVNKQAPYAVPIENDGVLVVDGSLIEVD